MRISISLLAGLALLACGGQSRPGTGGGEAAAARGAPPAVEAPAAAVSAAAMPSAGQPVAVESPASQTATRAESAGALPAPRAGQQTPTPATAASPPPQDGGWGTQPIERVRSGATAVLAAVRVTPLAGFDRVAFEFAGRVPGYRVAFAPVPVHSCGSGEPLTLPGQAVLVVAFRDAAAHDEAGRVTVADRDRRPGLPAVRALTLFCDFEGDVSWALALPRATRFRVTEPAGTSTLVVDVQHPG